MADIGNSIPSSYFAKALDVYEEGALVFPGVRIQRNYRNEPDVIRMCRARIRVITTGEETTYALADFLADPED